MAVDPLTVTVATVLASKALESVGGEAGRSAWAGIGPLARVVRRRFSGDPQATAALERAEENPDDAGRTRRLAEALQDHIEQDPSFYRQLAAWVEEARWHPTLGQFVTQVGGQAQIGAIITGGVVHGGVQVGMAQPSPVPPAQLPPDVAEFTGRHAELAQLRTLLSDSARQAEATVAILAITGTAGIGKTALAVRLAHQLAPRFPDIQLFVNLHGYDPQQRLTPGQVLDRFLRALGVAGDALPANTDEQTGLYRSLLASKHALVVVDNASTADQVRPLLPASPTCLVVVTSRDTLGGLVAREGARLLSLDVLTAGEAIELLARVAGHDRVDREPQTAAQVARLCGYLPLAVRIAAAKLVTRPAWTLAHLAGRLADEQHRLGELTAGDAQIRASFALSYDSLAPATARMFRRLGLIPGPDFTTGVAAALTDSTTDTAGTHLEALVDAHLLEAIPARRGRYRFHDLLRLYARERVLDEDSDHERAVGLRRMLDWYLDTADTADRLLDPSRRRLPRDRVAGRSESVLRTRTHALAWFEAEQASLVAATHQAAEWGLHTIAWQLADALWSFFFLPKHWADTCHVGLTAAREAGNRQAEAWMVTGLGVIYAYLRRFDEALDCYQQALAIQRAIGDRHGQVASSTTSALRTSSCDGSMRLSTAASRL